MTPSAVSERKEGGEFNLDAVFRNFDELRAAVARSIMVYNTKRTHWSLGLLTPLEMYERAA